MDEIAQKIIETKLKPPQITHKSIATFLKKNQKIDNLFQVDDWILENIRIPFFDYIYDFLIRFILLFIGLVAWYTPLPKPTIIPVLILCAKATGLSIALGIIIKTKKELWKK